MDDVIQALEESGYRVLLKIGDSGSNYYQLQKGGITYPQSVDNKGGISSSNILYSYEKYGITGVLAVFEAPTGSKLPVYTRKAKAEYRKRNSSFTFTINLETESSILDWLNRQSNKSGAVKGLILDAIERE